MKHELTNLHIIGSSTGNMAVASEYNGARFHVWLDRDTLQPRDDTLYKNSLLGAPAAEQFKTRTLAFDKGVGKIIVPQMLAAAPALLPVFLAELKAAEDRAKSKWDAEYKAKRVRDAAPELLEALDWLLNHPTEERGTHTAITFAQDVLAKAGAA